LGEIIRDMNKYSNNVMAHQLYLSLSAYAMTGPLVGSNEASAKIVHDWWTARFTAPEPRTQEGSGLSRDDRMSARGLTQLLQYAWESPYSAELIASLPISGLDGPLKKSQIAGLAHLKTGSLNGVLGVAGFVQAHNHHRYSLVVLVNHPNAGKARPMMDAWIEWVANH
jgi:D-alanyl-D-alanine carboxypeptidase/D-alanyl-D-alanine-endopeptidase (penicillin-binding protein 4)